MAGDAEPDGTLGVRRELEAVRDGSGLLDERLRETTRRARRYFESARAPATVRAYASDLADFETWCRIEAGGLSTLPALPETVALYIADAAGRGLKVSTINRRLTAISVFHKAAGLDSPALDERVKDVFKGIKREHGSLEKGAAPLLTPTIRRMIVVAGENAETVAQKKAAVRDAALLLVGYAGAFRRSEVVSLLVEDVEFVEGGATVLLRRSKTDQEGKGRKRALPYGSHTETCPVRNLGRWLELLGDEEEDESGNERPIFRPIDRHGNVGKSALSDRSVCEVVKKRAGAAGLERERYSGHSLRAGLATAASAAGVSQKSIMDQGDWRSVQTVMRYVREGTLFKNNAAASVGL